MEKNIIMKKQENCTLILRSTLKKMERKINPKKMIKPRLPNKMSKMGLIFKRKSKLSSTSKIMAA